MCIVEVHDTLGCSGSSSSDLFESNRAFPVVATRTWNDLPANVTFAESLPVFCQQLKAHLFPKSFPRYFLNFWLTSLDVSEPSAVELAVDFTT